MDRLPVDFLQTGSLADTPVRAHHAAPSSNMLLAAWRRPGLVGTVVVLALAGSGAAFVLMKRQYTAESVVQLNLERRESTRSDEGGAPVMLDASAIMQGELRIIRSRFVARGVVERLHLADERDGAATPGPMSVVGSWFSPWSTPVLDAWDSFRSAYAGPGQAPPPEDERALRVEAATDEVMAETTADSDNHSYLMTVKVTAGDPVLAAGIANAVAWEYINRQVQAGIAGAARTVEWLDGQIRQTTQQLRAAEAIADAYQGQSGLLELGPTETLNQQQLRDLSAQRTAALVARTEAQARLLRIQDAARAGGVPSAEDLRGAPQIGVLVDRRSEARARMAEVLSTVGPLHWRATQAQAALSSAEASLAAEVRHALSVAQGDVAAAERADEGTRQRLETLQQSVIAGKDKETELRSQQVALQALRDRVATLTRNRDQAQALQEVRPATASLIVPADVPRGPSSPKPKVVLPLGLAGGLGLGVLLAGMLERRDRGFRTGAMVEPVLGKRCVGMVPETSRGLARPDSGLAVSRSVGRRAAFETSLLAETVRSTAAALGLFDRARSCRVVVVTSSVAGEGKSVLCRTLSDCMAASGRRVLLVDGSPRRDEDRGHANDGTADLMDAVSAGSVVPGTKSGLTVLRRSTAGSSVNDVFGADGFARLLEKVRDHFDMVVIEGPPVMLVADSIVLGRMADMVIHVARWSSTKQKTVAAALNRMHDSGVTVDGVVLTRVDFGRHAALKAFDFGSYHLREKRFYEKLLAPAAMLHRGKPNGAAPPGRTAEPAREIRT